MAPGDLNMVGKRVQLPYLYLKDILTGFNNKETIIHSN
ncbi:hypothetical protein NMY3_00248 [Candidatus Nitrosocosmicus oleophilus]|uniref:Uncharacterized protein n=1 Tax=Candidatus Nitrosocosmicus oleophilus TaxID=1353260 RepID=A0A654M5Q5_9ARCH|nr:hypothetical protein NMY3_00248 [Candidatus Nitrosocosmicus oleophilus]